MKPLDAIDARYAELVAVAYPDYERCTGDDAHCPCSWHADIRDRDPGDPYHLHAASAREYARASQQLRAHAVGFLTQETDPECRALWLEVLCEIA